MRVKIHKLFEQFLEAHAARPEVSLVQSMSEAPRLGDFLDELDPELSLDWTGQSFQGLPSLREKVVARWGYAPVCNADDVLITAGTAEANFLAISNLVGPGDEMIVDVPGWPQPLVLGEAIGATVRKLVRDESSGWSIDLDRLADLITDKTKLIFICNPNNPTGDILDDAGMNRLIEMADKAGAWVLADEVYRGLEWGGEPAPRVAGMYERGISTGSVSKVLGLQGLRTGWLISRDSRLLFDAMVLREDTSEIMNVMGERIADIALGENRFERAIAAARNTGSRNLELVDGFIELRPELSWVRPRAGLIGFCRMCQDLNATRLSRELLAEPWRTFVMPGDAYGYADHIRIGWGGSDTREIEEGLDRLGRYLDQQGD